MKKDEAAEVGIGTMIVFIATILVAAVAAGVLINTSQKLQDKSTRTGTQATENVGSSLSVVDAVGVRTGGTGTIDEVDIFVTLAPGADPIDLDSLDIHYNDGAALTVFATHGDNANSGEFDAIWIRGTGTGNVMEPGDLVRLEIGDSDGTPTVGMAESTTVDINLMPAVGSSISVGFTAPTSFSDDNSVDLV